MKCNNYLFLILQKLNNILEEVLDKYSYFYEFYGVFFCVDHKDARGSKTVIIFSHTRISIYIY